MKTARSASLTHSRVDWMHPFIVILGVYVLATSFTNAYFMGDTWIYVRDVAGSDGLRANFWDFGHALWRPFGWLVARLLHPLTHLIVGEDLNTQVTVAFLAINWFFGLASALIVYFIARRFCRRRWLVYLITVAFLFSNPILNYAQTAQPYVPGLALILLGLYILVRDGRSPGRLPISVLLGGTALAGGACLWLPLIFSLPAVLLSPLVLFGFDRSRVRFMIQTGLVAAIVIVLVYALMVLNLGIADVAGLKAWISSASHGVLPDPFLKAFQRMIFALSRNLINMGDEGRLFKRYIVNDPFNPVSVSELFRFSLWKLAFFYLFLASLVGNLLFSRIGRRSLVLLLINGLPIFAFALFLFESGSIDRYLPLFPMLFLSLAVSLGSDAARSWAKYITMAFVTVLVVSNVRAMSAPALSREQERVAVRIRELEPLLKPQSRVVTANQQDEVYAFNQNFPFNPLNRSGRLEADILVDPGTSQIDRWRQIFARKTLASWESGGDVWITRRVLHSEPRAEWNWVEGDDPRVSWRDLHSFFSGLEVGQSVGGEDGFMLVLPSSQNRQLLVQSSTSESSKIRLP